MNRVLPLDPGFREKLKDLAGRVIAISFTDWQMQLFFLPDEYQFTVLATYNGKVNVKLSGNSWEFFRMGINKHLSTSTTDVDSNIHFEGDVSTGQKFEKLFAELNIDWEEALADVMGDIVAHRAANVARHAGSWFKEIFVTTQENVSEYLQEELQITPSKIEIENFYADLADLMADSEQLAGRFQLLEKSLIKADKLQDLPSK